jgi:HlyD family secretion protein
MKKSKFGILLLVLLAIATIYYLATTRRDNGLVLVGTVDANQVIVSAKIEGRIEKLMVDEGTPVKAGDLIAVLDSAELEAQKRQAEATLASSRSRVGESRYTEIATKGYTSSDVLSSKARVQSTQAQLAEAQADLDRQQLDTHRMVELAKAGVASPQDSDRAVASLKQAQARVDSLKEQVQSAESDLASTQARVNQAAAALHTVDAMRGQAETAQAQIAEADARLAYTKVFAPVTGIVSVRAAREGEVVNVGTPIVTIVDLNDTWVRAAVPETYGEKVAIGDILPVRLPSGSEVQGRVIFKAVEGDFATQRDVSRTKRDIKTIALKLQVDNSLQKLVPGMTAEVLVHNDVLNKPTSQAKVPELHGFPQQANPVAENK